MVSIGYLFPSMKIGYYTSILLSLPIHMDPAKMLNKRLKHKNDSSNFTINLCLKNSRHTGHSNRWCTAMKSIRSALCNKKYFPWMQWIITICMSQKHEISNA